MPANKDNRKKQFTVAAYMRTEVSTVLPTATVREVVHTMTKQKTNGVVVVDEDKKVQGILSSWDIIEHVVPDYLEADRHLAPFEDPDLFEQRINEVADDAISLFMTKNVHCVKATDTLMHAATLLSEFKIRQLPVVNNDGILVGYINRTDIKQAIAEVLGV